VSESIGANLSGSALDSQPFGCGRQAAQRNSSQIISQQVCPIGEISGCFKEKTTNQTNHTNVVQDGRLTIIANGEMISWELPNRTMY
jgi:hypothetical protein